MDGDNILTLFGLNIAELERYELTDKDEGFVTFAVRLDKGAGSCPLCGSIGPSVKDYRPKLCSFRS